MAREKIFGGWGGADSYPAEDTPNEFYSSILLNTLCVLEL